jgi:hypothetical protein
MTTEHDDPIRDQALEAVDKLTQPWGHLFGPRELGANNYKRVEYDPLLDSLKAAIHSSLGKTQDGASADNTRNPINLRAFDMWDNIDGHIRAWSQMLDTKRDDDAKIMLRRIYVKVHALPADATEHKRFSYMVRGWVNQINELFDPPIIKELVADCPRSECAKRYVIDDEGNVSAALIAYYRKDAQPEAKCRGCGAVWQGERQLLELGYSIKATVDEEALKEMGIAL